MPKEEIHSAGCAADGCGPRWVIDPQHLYSDIPFWNDGLDVSCSHLAEDCN
jgi:hypothetical protein